MNGLDRFLAIADTASKFKKVLIKRELKAAKTPCPHCKVGMIIGRIVGHKNHMHMACDYCEVKFHE